MKSYDAKCPICGTVNEVADQTIITVGMVLDPLLFFSSHAKRNDTVFVFFFHSKVLSINN